MSKVEKLITDSRRVKLSSLQSGDLTVLTENMRNGLSYIAVLNPTDSNRLAATQSWVEPTQKLPRAIRYIQEMGNFRSKNGHPFAEGYDDPPSGFLMEQDGKVKCVIQDGHHRVAVALHYQIPIGVVLGESTVSEVVPFQVVYSMIASSLLSMDR